MKKSKLNSEALKKSLLNKDSNYLTTVDNDLHVLSAKANNYEDQLSKILTKEQLDIFESCLNTWMLAFHNEKILALSRGRQLGFNDAIRFFSKQQIKNNKR